jgi:amidase
MTRTVRDAAIVLQALAGKDERDTATADIPADLDVDFPGALKSHALRGARIGVIRGPFGFRSWMEPVLANAVAGLRAAGAEIVDLGEPGILRQLSGVGGEIMLYEYKAGLNAYLAELSDARVKTMADVIAFNKAHAKEELALFGQEHMIAAQGKGPLTDKAYHEAREKSIRLSRTEGIDAMMQEHRLDALVALTAGPAGLGDPVYGGASPGTGGSSSLAAIAGYPSITVPAATVKGLPVGISFFGKAWTEATLLALAADFEAQTKARREPQLLPTLGTD